MKKKKDDSKVIGFFSVVTFSHGIQRDIYLEYTIRLFFFLVHIDDIYFNLIFALRIYVKIVIQVFFQKIPTIIYLFK